MFYRISFCRIQLTKNIILKNKIHKRYFIQHKLELKIGQKSTNQIQ